MVRSTVVLKIEADQLEDITELVDQLRHGMTGELAGFKYELGAVRHLIEPDIPKENA